MNKKAAKDRRIFRHTKKRGEGEVRNPFILLYKAKTNIAKLRYTDQLPTETKKIQYPARVRTHDPSCMQDGRTTN